MDPYDVRPWDCGNDMRDEERTWLDVIEDDVLVETDSTYVANAYMAGE